MSAVPNMAPSQAPAPRINIEKIAPTGLVLGLILTILAMAMMFTGGHQKEMMQSYMFGYIFWLSLTLGCFLFVNLYHLVRGIWLLPVLRLLEAGGGSIMLAVIGVLFLPILLPVVQGNPILYEWVDKTARSTDLLLKHKEPYLNPGFFTFRFVFYFVAWIAVAIWFKSSSVRQEKTGDLRELIKRNNTAGPAFVFFALSITFALTDWVMSLDPHWSSTMYGLWSAISMGIGGFAFCVMIFCLNTDKSPYKEIFTPNLTRDLNNILFVLTMLWAYTSLSQYLIIWSGNLPETNFYYIERSKAGWNAVGLVTIIGQFFMPFIMLLTPRNKKNPLNLAKVAGWMLFIHLIDIYQYVFPAMRTTGPFPLDYRSAFDLLALAGIGLLWLGVFGTVLKRSPLLPSFDNRLQEAVKHAH